MASEKALEAQTQESPPPYIVSESDHVMSVPSLQPPSYGETYGDEALGPPPTYESLFGKVKAAKAESGSKLSFLKKLAVILLGTLGCTICLGIFIAIPVAMIAIGSINLHKCNAEPYIPIYLIVGGCFGIMKNLSSIIQRVKNRQEEDAEEKNARSNPFDGVLSCFLFAWFLAGNVWVYRTYNEWQPDPLKSNYCDPTLYFFAFWIITSVYILMSSLCCCFVLSAIIAACCCDNEN